MSGDNDWIERYVRVNDLETIRTLCRHEGTPLRNLNSMPVGVACEMMKAELDEIFIPTVRYCEIISEVIQAALAHAVRHYPNRKTFLGNAYAEKLSFKPVVPIFLTGLAGTGKSQLGKAIVRLLGAERRIDIGDGHANFPLVAVSRITAERKMTLASILRTLADPSYAEGQGKLSGRGLHDGSTKWQYIIGSCLIILDELQFLTQSSHANTLIAKVLLRMTYVGPPTLVIGNYSMGHRLLKRPQEEKHRLLTNSRILLPDLPTSKCWLDVLEALEKVLPGIFEFGLVIRSNELWAFCAGLKRVLVELLTLAYRRARNTGRSMAAWQDVVSAYGSSAFFSSREDVEALVRQAFDGTTPPQHLQCPFPIPRSESESYGQALSSVRQHNLAGAVGRSALNASERQLEKEADQARAPVASNSATRSAKKKSSMTASDLIANSKRFRAAK